MSYHEMPQPTSETIEKYASLDEAYADKQLSVFPSLDASALRGSYVDWRRNTLYRDDDVSIPIYYRDFTNLPLPSLEK